jgi:hypothetical protein
MVGVPVIESAMVASSVVASNTIRLRLMLSPFPEELCQTNPSRFVFAMVVNPTPLMISHYLRVANEHATFST